MQPAINYTLAAIVGIVANIVASLLLRWAEEYEVIKKQSSSAKVFFFVIIFVVVAGYQLYISPASNTDLQIEQGQQVQSEEMPHSLYPPASVTAVGGKLIFLEQFVAILNVIPQHSWSSVLNIAGIVLLFQSITYLASAIYIDELAFLNWSSLFVLCIIIGYMWENNADGVFIGGCISLFLIPFFLIPDIKLFRSILSTVLGGALAGLSIAFFWLAIPGPFVDG